MVVGIATAHHVTQGSILNCKLIVGWLKWYRLSIAPSCTLGTQSQHQQFRQGLGPFLRTTKHQRLFVATVGLDHFWHTFIQTFLKKEQVVGGRAVGEGMHGQRHGSKSIVKIMAVLGIALQPITDIHQVG